MKICFGCDHGGFLLKEEVKKYFSSTDIEIVDFGSLDGDRVDYPTFGLRVAKSVANGECDYGVLICTTGIGMSIVANKVRGIRAALVTNLEAAQLTREHNDSNIICLGAKYTTVDEAISYIETFIKTSFSGGRHTNRVNMIKEVE